MLQNASAHKVSFERAVDEKEVKLDQLLNHLEALVHKYNTFARRLKIVPEGSKHSMGLDLSIQLYREASNIQDLCHTDHKVLFYERRTAPWILVKGHIRLNLQKTKERYSNKENEIIGASEGMHRLICVLQKEVQKLEHQKRQCAIEVGSFCDELIFKKYDFRLRRCKTNKLHGKEKL